MLKERAQEIFETAKYDATVINMGNGLFLVTKTITRGDMSLPIREIVNEESATVAKGMNIRGAIAPFIIVPLHPEWMKHMTKEDIKELEIFKTMFTEEEVAILTEFYTTHEDYKKATTLIEEEVIAKAVQGK